MEETTQEPQGDVIEPNDDVIEPSAKDEETDCDETGCVKNGAKKEKRQTFCSRAKAYLKALPKRYFITAFSGMAQGLFVTLIAGTILSMIAGWCGDGYFGTTLSAIANIAKSLMGAGIGVGIAHALGKNKLLVFSAAVAGTVGAFAENLLPGSGAFNAIALGKPGNPIGAYVAVMLVVEIISLYAGKTGLDIILIPLGTLFLAFLGIFAAYPFILLIGYLGDFIAFATDATPFVMGVAIAVIMGIVLTMPTSSAAIWAALANPVLTRYAVGNVSAAHYEAMLLAGGAATIGCACHMVGFAVASFRENKWSGLIAQGIGTSMLQIPNIMKKPVVMLPMILSSAILGPLSTCVFHVKCGASGGGMGTSGLVGVFDAFAYTSTPLGKVGIILLMIVLPAVLNLLFSELLRKKGVIKENDMLLPD